MPYDIVACAIRGLFSITAPNKYAKPTFFSAVTLLKVKFKKNDMQAVTSAVSVYYASNIQTIYKYLGTVHMYIYVLYIFL